MNTKITHKNTRTKAFLMFCAISLISTLSYAQTNIIPATGDVGIGTLTPSAKLDVNGRMNVDSMAVFKDSLRVQKKLIVDQDVKIQGKSVFVGKGKFKDKLVIDGITRMNGDAKIFGNLKIKSLENLSLSTNRFLLIQPNGKVTGVNNKTFFSTIYQPIQTCFTNQNGEVLAMWKQKPNQNFGILYTGTDCSTRVGIGTDNPQANLDVVGFSRFEGGVSIIRNANLNINSLAVIDANNYQFKMVVKSNGFLGIGTDTPEDKLQVGKGIAKLVVGSATGQILGYGTNYIGFNIARKEVTTNTFLWKTDNDGANGGGAVIYGDVFGGLRFSTVPTVGATNRAVQDGTVKNNTRLYIHHKGNIGIGTDKVSGYKLSVDGNIRAREIDVNLNTWADFVFYDNYQLRPLKQVEEYINQNKHLPDVPSEKEVLVNGVSLGEMNVVLLQKIEELILS